MATAVAEDIKVLSVLERLAQTKKLLNVSDVCELLNESDDVIYRRTKKGSMPYVRLGSSIKFDPAQVARWLREHYVG